MAAVPLRVTGGIKSFRNHGHVTTVFENIDLAVDESQILALLGPSGCGKSTLLRVIAGLDQLDSGRVEISSVEDHARDVGIVFQQPLLLPWLTVRENVELGLRYRANHGAREDGLVQRTLVEFGLADLADAYPDELSGGQAQRVSFARTLVTRPRIVLLDEPFGALDPLTRQSMQDWLIDVQHRLKLTVLMVTHDVDEAVRLGHQVFLMSPQPGRIRCTWALPDGPRSPELLNQVRDEVLNTYREVQLATAAPSGDEEPIRVNYLI